MDKLIFDISFQATCIKSEDAFAKAAKKEPSQSACFASLLANKHFSDVALECGGRSFECHKAILCAWSDVFLAMLSHSEMRENQTGKVHKLYIYLLL